MYFMQYLVGMGEMNILLVNCIHRFTHYLQSRACVLKKFDKTFSYFSVIFVLSSIFCVGVCFLEPDQLHRKFKLSTIKSHIKSSQ